MINFYEYSRIFIHEDSPLGDLARDVAEDENFRELKNTRADIESYLTARCASDGALRAFDAMWRSYLRHLRASRWIKDI